MNNQSPKGNRIAKVLSRVGIASRREAEKLILAGRVKVNGEILTSPAFNVLDSDIILVEEIQSLNLMESDYGAFTNQWAL